jgi:hypothetical protein
MKIMDNLNKVGKIHIVSEAGTFYVHFMNFRSLVMIAVVKATH